MAASQFGRTTITGNTNSSSNTGSNNQVGSSATIGADGRVTAIGGYCSGNGSALAGVVFLIWDASGNILGQSGAITIPSGNTSVNGQAWNDHVALKSYVDLTNGTQVFLGFFRPAANTLNYSWINTGTSHVQGTNASVPSALTNSAVTQTESFYGDYIPTATLNAYAGPRLIDFQYAHGGAGSATITPANVQVGDLLLASYNYPGGSAVSDTLPSGFAQLDKVTNATAGMTTIVAWKVATAGDVGTAQTFSCGVSGNDLILMVWRGAFTATNSAADIFDGHSGQSNTSSANWTCPSITPAGANSVVLVIGQSFGNVSSVRKWPTTDFIPIHNDNTYYLAYWLNTSATATGTLTGTLDKADQSIGYTLGIKAAPSAKAVVDSATGLDTPTIATVAVANTDAGSGAEVVVAGSAIPVPDAGTGADVVAQIGHLLTDAGTGADVVPIAVTPAIPADAGAGADAEATKVTTNIPADPATGTEAISWDPTVPVQAPEPDRGMGVDTYLRGVNLTGAEFGANHIPGVAETDYHYNTPATYAFLASRGISLLRLPFRWERLQQTRNTPLDANELARLKGAVDNARANGMQVLLDAHNFSRYLTNGGATTLVLGTDFPAADLADFWTRVSTAFKGYPGVFGYDLMNEPSNMADVFVAASRPWDWEDGTVQSWGIESGAQTLANSTAFAHDGTHALAGTQAVMPGSGFVSFRFDRANDGLTQAGGKTLSAWVLVPVGTPGTSWNAHLEIQDQGFVWHAGADITVTPGVWSQVTFTPADILWVSHKAVNVQISVNNAAGGSATVYVDTYEQGNITFAAQIWEAAAQACVTAIRANGDATPIIVEGYNFSGAQSWASLHPSAWIVDTIPNAIIYSAHYYFDTGNGGTYPNTFAVENTNAINAGYASLQDRATQELTRWLEWVRANNAFGLLGEIGWRNDESTASWNAVATALYALLNRYGIGVTQWAESEWFGSYNLAAYQSVNSSSPLSIVTSAATVVEANPSLVPVISVTAPLGDGPDNAGQTAFTLSNTFALSPDAAAGAEILYSNLILAPQPDAGAGAEQIAIAATFGLTQPAAGAETPTLSVVAVALSPDAGTGADAQATYVPFAPPADAGTGADGVSSLAATLPVADAGAGADAPSLVATISVPVPSDLAAGADALAVTILTNVPNPPPDLGAGADAATLAFPILVAVRDAGTGQEIVVGQVTLAVPVDSASGLDVATTTAVLPVVDASATGAESVALATVTVSLADAGVSSDNVALLVSFPVPDTGAGTDIPYLGVVGVSLADNPAGADIPNVALRAPNLPDPGTGTDAPSFPALAVAIADAGTGTDIPLATTATLAIPPETAGGADAMALATVAIPLSDAASAVEGPLLVTVSAPIPDPAAGSDIPSNVLGIAIADASTGLTVQTATVTLPVPADAATGADAPAVVPAPSVADAGTGAEGTSPTFGPIQVSVADGATGTRVVAFGPTIVAAAVNDPATAADAFALNVGVSLSDPGTGVEVGVAPSQVSIALADAAGANELGIQTTRGVPVPTDLGFGGETLAWPATVTVNAPDAAIGVEVTALLIMPAVADTAVGVDTPPTFTSSPATFALLDNATGAQLLAFGLTPILLAGDAAVGADGVAVANLFFVAVPLDLATGRDTVALVPFSRATLSILSGPGGARRATLLVGPGNDTFIIPVSSYDG